MGEVERVVSNLVQVLDRGQKEAKTLVDTMDQLQSYLEEGSRNIIQESLDRLLSRVGMEVDNLIGGSAVVLISPEGRVTVRQAYSDEWIERLKSQDFWVMRLDKFSSFIDSLKSNVVEGNLIPVIEFLRENTEFEWPSAYSPTPALRESEHGESSASSEWKLSDFLPALPPHPPLPRGLFKD